MLNGVVGSGCLLGQWSRIEVGRAPSGHRAALTLLSACPMLCQGACTHARCLETPHTHLPLLSVHTKGLPVNADPNDPSTHIKQRPLFNQEGKLEPNITVLGEDVRVEDEVLVLHCMVLPRQELVCDRKNEIIF